MREREEREEQCGGVKGRDNRVGLARLVWGGQKQEESAQGCASNW